MPHSSRKPVARMLLVALLAGSLSACVVGPDYHQPEIAVAAQFDNAVAAPIEPQRDFWLGFNDAQLTALINEALAANHDIRIAIANLRQARASLREVDANSLPQVDLETSVNRTVQPQSQAPGSRESRTKNIYAAGLDFNWEINFFGRYTRANEAAVATASAAQAGVQAVQVSVTAEVARNYFELRGQQRQLQLVRQAVDNLSAVSQLVETREQLGRGTQLDVLRARALYENTQARIPVLESNISRTIYRLSVLTGKQPTELTPRLQEVQPLPGLAVIDGIGTPDSLLRRRPDIRLAERQLAAATASIGVTKADLFPSVSITGLLGLNAGTFAGLGKDEAFRYDIGASMIWNLLDFGRIRARIVQKEAGAEAALATYEKTVLLALEETEGALSNFNHTQRQTNNLFRANEASEEAAKLSRLRFEAGASNFLDVLDAEREHINAQEQLTDAQTRAATSLIAVYKALGGGWAVTADSRTTAKQAVNQ